MSEIRTSISDWWTTSLGKSEEVRREDLREGGRE